MAKISLYELEYVVFDFETTGLDAYQHDDIIEIGALKLRGPHPTGEIFHTLIDIGRKIPPQATQVHGITTQDLKGQPTIETVFPKFLEFIGPKMLIAHNAEFDLSFIHKNLMRFPELPFHNYCLDTLSLSKQLFSYEKKHNLDAIVQRFEIRKENDRHRSVGDCMLTAKIFSEFLETLKRKKLATLEHIRGCMIPPPRVHPRRDTESLSLF
ncbi:MAG: 3'-5' exonuclease [Deltaproteobacteria bacterium]|nr:3'-5' exonuclease [Deltaproteobacteria bacterium]